MSDTENKEVKTEETKPEEQKDVQQPEKQDEVKAEEKKPEESSEAKTEEKKAEETTEAKNDEKKDEENKDAKKKDEKKKDKKDKEDKKKKEEKKVEVQAPSPAKTSTDTKKRSGSVFGTLGRLWSKKEMTPKEEEHKQSAPSMSSASAPWHTFNLPMAVLTDSYKAAHFKVYPDARKMVCYGEFRTPFSGQKSDERFVFYGIRYIVENYLNKKWTVAEVEQAEQFYKQHNAGNTAFPFPKDLFLRFIKENDGYFPVRVEALPEGTVAHVHTPVFQITAYDEYAPLCTWMETLFVQVWYPTTVATLSRMSKDVIAKAFERTVDPESAFLLNSRLHDFGFRGCTCVEQSIIGGCAHLLSFEGSDTMSAAYFAQFHLNGGKPVATSIPATEHSVMTSFQNEREAIKKVIDQYGSGVYACVLDSYDYVNALENVLPSLAKRKLSKGGVLVMRPDSGDPVDNVIAALQAAEKIFGAETNKKGFKVVNKCSVMQGDGVNKEAIDRVLTAVQNAGYSAQNVTFGMGGGLLQKVNRDTMGFATKLNFIEYADKTTRDVMKLPKTDMNKRSLPGILRVVRDENGHESVIPSNGDDKTDKDLLKVVYDCRPLEKVWDDFDTIKDRVSKEWAAAPEQLNVISPALREKMDAITEREKKNCEAKYVEDDFVEEQKVEQPVEAKPEVQPQEEKPKSEEAKPEQTQAPAEVKPDDKKSKEEEKKRKKEEEAKRKEEEAKRKEEEKKRKKEEEAKKKEEEAKRKEEEKKRKEEEKKKKEAEKNAKKKEEPKKADSKTEVKEETKSEPKEEVKTEAKPEETKSESTPEEAKPESKPEEAKTEAKPEEVKPEEANPDTKQQEQEKPKAEEPKEATTESSQTEETSTDKKKKKKKTKKSESTEEEAPSQKQSEESDNKDSSEGSPKPEKEKKEKKEKKKKNKDIVEVPVTEEKTE